MDTGLELVNEMPIVKAMKAHAPLTDDVVHVPVELPHALYIRSGDWEHDDAVVACTYIAISMVKMVDALLPNLPDYDAKRETIRIGRVDAEKWLLSNYNYQGPYVTVVIPIPIELMGREWPHWLAVAVGRYAGDCIQAHLHGLGVGLGYSPETLGEGLMKEWDNEINASF